MTGWEDNDVDIELDINGAFKKNDVTARSIEKEIYNGWDLDDFEITCNESVSSVEDSIVHNEDGQVPKSSLQDDSFMINEFSNEKIVNDWNLDDGSNDLHTPMKYQMISSSLPSRNTSHDNISSDARNFLCEESCSTLGSYDPEDSSAVESLRKVVSEIEYEKAKCNLEGWDDEGIENLLTKEISTSKDLWSFNELQTSSLTEAYDVAKLDIIPQSTEIHHENNIPEISLQKLEKAMHLLSESPKVDHVQKSDEYNELANYQTNISPHPQFISEGGSTDGNENESIHCDLTTNNDVDHLHFISGTDHVNPTIHQSELGDNSSSVENAKDDLDLSKLLHCEPPLVSNLGWEVDDLEVDMSEDAEDELDAINEPSNIASEGNEDIVETNMTQNNFNPAKTWLNGIFTSIQDISSKHVDDFETMNKDVDHRFPKSKVANEASFKDLLDKIAPKVSNVTTYNRNRESDFSQYKSLFDKMAHLPNLSPSIMQRNASDRNEENEIKELFSNLNGTANDKGDERNLTSPIMNSRFISGGVSVLGKISTSTIEIAVIYRVVSINFLIF